MTTTKEIKREGFTEGEVAAALPKIHGRRIATDIDAIEWAASRYLEALRDAKNWVPLPDAEKQLIEAKKVLAWYADERHWQFTHVPQSNIVWNDRGQRARDFLGVGE